MNIVNARNWACGTSGAERMCGRAATAKTASPSMAQWSKAKALLQCRRVALNRQGGHESAPTMEGIELHVANGAQQRCSRGPDQQAPFVRLSRGTEQFFCHHGLACPPIRPRHQGPTMSNEMLYKEKVSTSFFPFWSELGRKLVLGMISAPQNIQLLERISEAPDLLNIFAGLSLHQPSAFKVVMSLCVIGFLMIPIAAAFVTLRFMGRCGSKRIQVITPMYSKTYKSYFVALASFTIGFMVLNGLLVGFGVSIDHSMRQASSFYEKGLDDLDRYLRHTAWNGTALKAKRTARQVLSVGFTKAFREYMLGKMERGTGREGCGRLLKAMLDERSQVLLMSCDNLESLEDSILTVASQKFRDKTVVKGKLTRGSGSKGAEIVASVRAKLSHFERQFHLREFLGASAPLVVILAVVVGFVIALYGVGLTLGMLNHDKGMAPTQRNGRSHHAGLIMLYNPVLMFLAAVIAVPLATMLLTASIIGECYFCEPYRGRQRHILDEEVSRLFAAIGEKTLDVSPSRIMKACTVAKGGRKKAVRLRRRAAVGILATCILTGCNNTLQKAMNIRWSKRLQKWTGLASSGTFHLDDVLQPALTAFYRDIVVQTERPVHGNDSKVPVGGASDCGVPYHIMTAGFALICGPVLGNYHGTWIALLALATILVGAIPISLRLSKFYLVMDQYCYAGWDDRASRKPPRRRKLWGKRIRPEEEKEAAGDPGIVGADAQGTPAARESGSSNSEDDPPGTDAWRSETYLLGRQQGPPSESVDSDEHYAQHVVELSLCDSQPQ